MRRAPAARWRSSGLALVVLASWSMAAHAAERTPKPDNRMTEVKRACVGGEVDKGVALLAELYAETNDPTAIYDQGRCYQQNARPELAVAKFQEYLRKAKDLTASDRAEVETFIKELNEDIERSRNADAHQAPASTPASSLATAPEARPGSGLRKLGVGLAALGVVAVGVGIVFTVKMDSKQDEIDRQTRAPGIVNGAPLAGPLADGNRYETLQYVGYGIGLVALAAGTTCYLVGARTAARARASVAPLAAPGVAGVSLAGTF